MTSEVSTELRSMMNSNNGYAPAKSTRSNPFNNILAVASLALGIVVVCLSIAVVRTSQNEAKVLMYVSQIPTSKPPPGDNICKGTKVDLPNIACVVDEITKEVDPNAFALGTAEQSGVNVTLGYQGGLDVDTVPITGAYWKQGLCPVNVHWHLGSEHYSVGQYDENGSGPSHADGHRKLAENARPGFQCHHFDATDSKFTTEYEWKHCVNTHVGETYEVHWPHSNMGDCGTPNQYQTPFYDGVFCRFATDFEGSLANAKIGVQGQVFTIVNDEAYYYPDLIRGMIVDGEKGTDIATFTGSTTGTSRDNNKCSQYTGITWQVDRKCHLISASSFDKMCADMKAQRDDMKDDLYPHGSRELVADHLAADNHQRKLRGF